MKRTGTGFTLVEFIVVIVVIGIISSMTALFMRNPVVAYLDAARRAELVDIADTALMRMARDVRSALPNSVRVTSDAAGRGYLEFLPVTTGGRYRAEAAAVGDDPLDFTTTDGSFDVLGPAVTVSPNQFLVIYNLGQSVDDDAWRGGNRRVVTSSGSVSKLAFTPTASPLPMASPSHRFFITAAPVTYVCDPVTHEIKRYWGYAPQAVHSDSIALLSGLTPALLATRVVSCRFTYSSGASQRLGQLTLSIQLENADGDNAEQVSLYREVAVNNEP